MHPFGQAIWGHIWRHTVEKSQTNATSVIMHPCMQVLWGHIWKSTVEKSRTNATSVIMHPPGQTVWRLIWKRIVEKSRTNATNVTIHVLRQEPWGDTWKHTAEESQTNDNSVILAALMQAHWFNTQRRKVNLWDKSKQAHLFGWCWGKNTNFYCPRSFSGGGLYLKGSWLLWSMYYGLLWSVTVSLYMGHTSKWQIHSHLGYTV